MWTNDFLCLECIKPAVNMWFYLISWGPLIVKYECFVPNSDSRAVRMINGDLDNVCSRPKRKWTRWILKQINFKFCPFFTQLVHTDPHKCWYLF